MDLLCASLGGSSAGFCLSLLFTFGDVFAFGGAFAFCFALAFAFAFGVVVAFAFGVLEAAGFELEGAGFSSVFFLFKVVLGFLGVLAFPSSWPSSDSESSAMAGSAPMAN